MPPRYVETVVTLSASQAAGTSPILAAEAAFPGIRKSVLLGNPGVAPANLFLNSGGVMGQGMPLSAGGLVALDTVLPGLDNSVYVVGLTTGAFLTLWVA
jgi:hypothetical protein